MCNKDWSEFGNAGDVIHPSNRRTHRHLSQMHHTSRSFLDEFIPIKPKAHANALDQIEVTKCRCQKGQIFQNLVKGGSWCFLGRNVKQYEWISQGNFEGSAPTHCKEIIEQLEKKLQQMDCILVAGISPVDTITSIFIDFSPSVGCTQASKSCHQKQAQRNGCLIMFKSSSSFLDLEARNKNTSWISLRQLRKISRSLQTSKNNEKARLVRLVGSYWIP